MMRINQQGYLVDIDHGCGCCATSTIHGEYGEQHLEDLRDRMYCETVEFDGTATMRQEIEARIKATIKGLEEDVERLREYAYARCLDIGQAAYRPVGLTPQEEADYEEGEMEIYADQQLMQQELDDFEGDTYASEFNDNTYDGELG